MKLVESNRIFLERLLTCKALRLTYDEDLDSDKFWDSEDVIQWFNAQGYALYNRVREPKHYTQYSVPALPFEDFRVADYPHAYHNAYPVDGNNLHMLTTADFTGRIVYAQDSQGRHVVIKATHKDTEEYRISQFLHVQSLEVLRGNCVLPILKLLKYDNARFIVMPRWGGSIDQPIEHLALRDVLRIVQSVLKSLTFLHSHNIIHRDLSFGNVLVNHFGPEPLGGLSGNPYWQTRAQQMSKGKLQYALIDFDLAKMLPEHIKRDDYRLPAQESDVGTYYPEDTLQGEFDYNPFAYDVGTLGVIFSTSYEHHARDIPLLAPFFDRLSTRDVRKRFTAAEALSFLERIIAESTDDQLSTVVSPRARGNTECDKWESLPADFQRDWAAYRKPTDVPLTTRVLRAFVQCPWIPGLAIVRNTRWFFSRLTLPLRHARTQLVGYVRHFGL